MDVPNEIDLYEWTQYAIFRSLLKQPFPSPRVWDNAGSLGYIGGNYKKDKFFDPELFDPSLYLYNQPSIYVKNKYGGKLTVKSGQGQLLKADGQPHSLFENESTNHMYLNFDSFLKTKNITNKVDYGKIYSAVREIYYICRVQCPGIDSGFLFVSFENNSGYDDNESKWYELNRRFIGNFNTNFCIKEYLYESVASIFGCSKDKLLEITEVLNFDFWFIEMFCFSFKRPLNYFYSIKSKQDDVEKMRNYEGSPQYQAYLKKKNKSINQVTKLDIPEEEIEKMRNYEGSPQYQAYCKRNSIPINKTTVEKSSFETESKDLKNEINSLSLAENNNKKGSNLGKNNENLNPNDLRFIPSEAKIPIGFKSFGDQVKDLEFALNNPSISFRSFLNDCEFIKDGNWIEETLFCQAFDEGLYCQLIKEYHRFSIAELNSMKAEEMKKAERKGAGIGGLFGLLAGGIMAPITAAMGANVGKMISNNVDERKPLKDFLPEPFLVFLKDQGSYLSLSKTYKGTTTKRRICLKKNSLNNENIYFDLIPMIVFDNWVTPAQIFKLDNSYYLRPISANYDLNNEFNIQYNPVKYRRSYSYDPRGDIEKIANSKVKTRIVGETIEKTPTIFHAWLRDDESFQHFYFDYSTDGTIF